MDAIVCDFVMIDAMYKNRITPRKSGEIVLIHSSNATKNWSHRRDISSTGGFTDKDILLSLFWVLAGVVTMTGVT